MTEDVAAFAHLFNQQQYSASSSIGNAIRRRRSRPGPGHRDVAHDKSLMCREFSVASGGNRRIQQAITSLNIARLLQNSRIPSPLSWRAQAKSARLTRRVPDEQITHRHRSAPVQESQPLQIFRLTFTATRRVKHHTRAPASVLRAEISRSTKRSFPPATAACRTPARQGYLPAVNASRDVAGGVVNMQRLPLGQGVWV